MWRRLFNMGGAWKRNSSGPTDLETRNNRIIYIYILNLPVVKLSCMSIKYLIWRSQSSKVVCHRLQSLLYSLSHFSWVGQQGSSLHALDEKESPMPTPFRRAYRVSGNFLALSVVYCFSTYLEVYIKRHT